MRTALRLLSSVPAYGVGRRGNKLTTGLHGLPVHPDPLPQLVQIYKSTLTALESSIPKGVVYRQSAEAITQHRLSVVEKHQAKGGEDAVEAVEQELGAGVIEEVIKVAEGERSLVDKMAEWKS